MVDRARDAAGRGASRREVPLAYRDPQGVLVEGIIDLAFLEGDRWVIVDFQTDPELEDKDAAYRAQVAAYVAIVSAATRQPARGFLVSL